MTAMTIITLAVLAAAAIATVAFVLEQRAAARDQAFRDVASR